MKPESPGWACLCRGRTGGILGAAHDVGLARQNLEVVGM